MAFNDPSRGFIPQHTPREGQCLPFLVDAAETIYPGTLVFLNTDGELVAHDTGTISSVLGVAMDYATGLETCNVCVDPDMVYLVRGSSTFSQTRVGERYPFQIDLAQTAGPPSNLLSSAQINLTTAGTANTDIFMVVGTFGQKADSTENNFRVKIIHSAQQLVA